MYERTLDMRLSLGGQLGYEGNVAIDLLPHLDMYLATEGQV